MLTYTPADLIVAIAKAEKLSVPNANKQTND